MQWVNKALSSVSPSHHGSSPSSFSAAYNQINMEELSQAEDNSLLADAEAISHADLDPNDSDDDDSVLRDVEATIFKSQPPIPISSDKPEISRLAFFFWVGVNCIATLGIVLVNKQILGNPTLRGAPTLFVAYHFFLTSATLHIASSSFVGAFERKISPLVQLLPLAFVFAGHTVVTNWSLVSPPSFFSLSALPLTPQMRCPTGTTRSSNLSRDPNPSNPHDCHHQFRSLQKDHLLAIPLRLIRSLYRYRSHSLLRHSSKTR